MKRLPFVLLLILTVPFAVADSPWQYGRIVEVRKSVTLRTKAMVVNTPINEEETSYIISVHVADKIVTASYEFREGDSAPPPEWTANYPVRVQTAGDTMYLRAPTGSVTLHVTRTRNAAPMLTLTAEEKKRLAEMDAPSDSLIGFQEDKKTAAPQPAAQAPPQPPPPPPNAGTVTVRSTPFLSEVFVDGDSMGYTPAKISLPPGKHTFRVEKPGYKTWTKEITITVGSELTLDAGLEKK